MLCTELCVCGEKQSEMLNSVVTDALEAPLHCNVYQLTCACSTNKQHLA